LPALAASEQRGLIPLERAKRLRDAYRFLRRLENRVQMFGDQQTHDLPTDETQRLRMALALGYARWQDLVDELDQHRAAVSKEFDAVMAPARRARNSEKTASWNAIWQRCLAGDMDAEVFEAAGITPVAP